jgi:hypothetical protein
VDRLVTYRVSEDFDHFAAVLCNYNVRAYQNQAFLECVDIPEALFMRHVGTRIIMFVERVDWIGLTIYILHGEARGTWPWISI